MNGGLSDPLLFYERSFADLEDEPAAYHRIAEVVALRFPDPLGRRDASGRVIPHEFVISGALGDRIESVADGLRQIWPLSRRPMPGSGMSSARPHLRTCA